MSMITRDKLLKQRLCKENEIPVSENDFSIREILDWDTITAEQKLDIAFSECGLIPRELINPFCCKCIRAALNLIEPPHNEAALKIISFFERYNNFYDPYPYNETQSIKQLMSESHYESEDIYWSVYSLCTETSIKRAKLVSVNTACAFKIRESRLLDQSLNPKSSEAKHDTAYNSAREKQVQFLKDLLNQASR